MGDRKPPRLEGGERATLQALLQYQRRSFADKVRGVDEQAARRSPVGSGTSLLWLVKHMARAELTWVVVRFAGEEVELPGGEVQGADTVAGALDHYRSAGERVDAVVASCPDLDRRCRRLDDGDPVNLRWVLMHLLEETARHAGHADILRELIDGSTGR